MNIQHIPVKLLVLNEDKFIEFKEEQLKNIHIILVNFLLNLNFALFSLISLLILYL